MVIPKDAFNQDGSPDFEDDVWWPLFYKTLILPPTKTKSVQERVEFVKSALKMLPKDRIVPSPEVIYSALNEIDSNSKPTYFTCPFVKPDDPDFSGPCKALESELYKSSVWYPPKIDDDLIEMYFTYE